MSDAIGEPGSLDQAARKTVLRQITYGMYAVSAAWQEQRGIFTANWVTQVSFEPPLLVVSIERDSTTLALIRASGRFVLSPFTADQMELARDLGRSFARVGDKFDAFGLPVVLTETGDPALASALGFIVCATETIVEAGDSVLVLGRVIEAAVLNEGEPLTMRAAGFRHAG